MSKGSAALAVDILANDIEIGDIARCHAIDRGLAAKEARPVRFAHPFVGGLGHEDLETLVDAHHIGNALERVLAERRDIAALPVVKGRTAVETEETHLFDLAEIPCLGDVEECAARRPRQLLASQCFCRDRKSTSLNSS